MKKKCSLILALGCFVSTIFAQEAVLARKNDNLDTVAERYFEKISFKYHSIEEYKNDLRKWNSDVLDWNKIPKEKILYVYYPYSNYLGDYVLPDKDQHEVLKEKSNLSFYYNFLTGDYKENSENEEISSQLVYPVSLGLKGEYLLNAANAIELDFHWKSAVKNKIDNVNEVVVEKIDNKNSFNGHLHYKKYFLNKDLNVFAGYTQESFNTVKISAGDDAIEVTSLQSTYHFASMGIGYNFYLFNTNFYSQFKYQSSVASKKNELLIESDFKNNAKKTQLLLAYKSYNSFYINAFFDQIKINYQENTTATINQIGFGVGFDLL